MQKSEEKITFWSAIRLGIAYYIYKFGIWLTKLSYSLAIVLIAYGIITDTLNVVVNIYFPLALFSIALIFIIVGAAWSLSQGVDLANLVLFNITKILHKDN